MSRDGKCGVLRDVACGLCGSVFDVETSEAAKIYILFLLYKAGFYLLHESLYYNADVSFGQSSCNRHLVNDICFSHISFIFLFINLNRCAKIQVFCEITKKLAIFLQK